MSEYRLREALAALLKRRRERTITTGMFEREVAAALAAPDEGRPERAWALRTLLLQCDNERERSLVLDSYDSGSHFGGVAPRAAPASPAPEAAPCGARDPMSPRRCARPAGHEGLHQDTEEREAQFAAMTGAPSPAPEAAPRDCIAEFEAQAEEFRRLTGFMAPGKDVAPCAAYCDEDEEERHRLWQEYRAGRLRAPAPSSPAKGDKAHAVLSGQDVL